MEKTHFTLDRGARSPNQRLLEKQLPEWIALEKWLREFSSLGEIEILGWSRSSSHELPLVGASFGSQEPQAPVLALFAGVHGLERIGSQVVLSLMQSFSESLLWDQVLQETLKRIRILFFPLVNPLGVLNKTRANPQGVDLMRNSPVESDEKPHWLLGGQRISSTLPWYRGSGKLEPEAEAVLQFCQKKFFLSQAVITVDFHSGFGLQDQIWFPYAKTRKPFPHLSHFSAWAESFEKSHPHHFYRIEPQASNYITHGDLWDFVYDEFRSQNAGAYLPLTLEMGSWMWMKKNPLQALSSLGIFNPVKPHRQKRVLRRHLSFFEFLIRATASHGHWSDLKPERRNRFAQRALKRWYETGEALN